MKKAKPKHAPFERKTAEAVYEEVVMTCAWCGHVTPVDSMSSRLPIDHFQCAGCMSILVRKREPAYLNQYGYWMPGKTTIERLAFELAAGAAP